LRVFTALGPLDKEGPLSFVCLLIVVVWRKHNVLMCFVSKCEMTLSTDPVHTQ